ncbi:MAG: hypothetical protein ACW99A_03150 [Candidatus Kariarchaeaceae archaeon]|jgi:hypothetical protein
MFARKVEVTIRPGTMDDAISIYENSVVPAAKQLDGFKEGYLFINRENNTSVSIAIYDTLENLNASQESGFLQEQFAKFGAQMAGPPETSTYEIAVKF